MRSDRFSRVVTEGVTLSAVDLSIQAEIPSGPVALEVTRLVRKKWTSSSVHSRPSGIRISVPFHGSVPTNRTLSSTGPLSAQLKRSYRLHASIKAYFVGTKALGRRSCSR